METAAQPFSWLLIALFTATLARTGALGLALVAAIRWYVRRPGAPPPWGRLRYFVYAAPQAILKTTATVAGFAGMLVLWIWVGIAVRVLPLATPIGVVFLAMAPFVIPLALRAVEPRHERARARRQYGYLLTYEELAAQASQDEQTRERVG